MTSPTLVDATDLEQWADRLEAQGLFPQLVRRLILATGQQLRKVSFRSGEGTRHRGWDGVVKAGKGTPFVPAGVSGWELGTGKDVRRKAQEDYQKRTRNPGVLKPKQTTFVFVTPRRWRDKQEWAQERRRKGKWRDVWVHDADDLETWLEKAPAVHVWLSIRLGKRPADVLDLETHWEDWNAAHAPPPFDKEVVIRIHRWLRAKPASLPWPADSREEAIAIFAAALHNLPEEKRTSLLSRTVVVCSEQALRVLADRSCPLIFVVDFEVDALAVADATRKGHHVLVPVGQEAPLRPVVPRSLPGPLTPGNLLKALQAPYRLVEFTGKGHRDLCEEAVHSLQGLTPDGSHAWVLWGPGGAGKTRTAVEVALALEKEGWLAFSVDFHPSPPEDRLQHFFTQRWPNRPILLIVDYAEQRPADDLRALARAVREAVSKRSAPVALLFLMRADPREPAAGHVTVALKEARIHHWKDQRVPSVEDPEDRQALFRKARARFREELAPPGAPPEVDYDPEYLPRTPLAILALAVLAAHGHRVARSENEVEVLTALWEQWERPRWRRTLEAQGGGELLQTPEVWAEARARIEQALAAASLGRPFAAPDEVAAWWEAYFPFQARTARGDQLDPSWLAQRLKVLFPAVGEAWRLPPISPDPLADVVLARFGADLGHLVDSILPAPEAVKAEEIVTIDWPARMVVEVLPRLSAAAVPGASEAARAALEAATRWLEKTVEVLPQEVAAAWLGTWDRALPPPDRTVLLRPFEEVAYRSWVKQAIDEAERARALGMWGFALSALGRRAEALEAAQEAVALYRRLAAQHPDAFLPNLAMSLHNLGIRLFALGRRAEALQATQEALDLYRRLAAQHPDAFLPSLARSLNNLGVMLFALGRRAEALQATQEALDLYRRLAAQHPDAFLPSLAMSLHNLGIRLFALGRRAEALQATQEALDLYRRLAAQHPDAFLPYLAASLHNLGSQLSALGRRAEALQATQEALDLYRRLAAQHPDAFLPDLARSLGAYGLVLRGLGRSAEATAAFAEGLQAILPFARALPAAFGGLAGALLQGYLPACAEAGEAPDEALVAQVRRAIE